MRIKANVGQAGIMTLRNGTREQYGVIRFTGINDHQNLIYYTGKGLREIHKPNMTPEENIRSEELRKKEEKWLIVEGYIKIISLKEIVSW